MKRKTSKVGKLRLSPNEETMLLKEEYERRRKLRLQQVCLCVCKLSVSLISLYQDVQEPDLEALAKQAEERKQRAEKRHKKALKEQKLQKEKLLREQARYAALI
ncbi:UNVERIFIED_CONTAM: hypothetical protein H355_006162 [Colinus virginianus]|nr:hypothetical protein H355_006162 [Colinus virginianus]